MSTQPLTFVEEKQEQTPQQFDITWSPTVGKLFEALAKAQLKFKPVIKGTDNAAFMRAGRASKYADLAEYIASTQEALASEGLIVTQWPDVSPEAKSMSLISVLGHSSGEWMKGRLTLPATNRDGFTAQSCGSSITYARRYSYSAITGCASEDDDGNAASGVGSKDAAAAVAAEKIATFKKTGKLPKGEPNPEEQAPPDTLFYVYETNGHFAEFINLKDYGSGLNPTAAEGLRRIFARYLNAPALKKDMLKVSRDHMDQLLEELKGVEVKTYEGKPA